MDSGNASTASTIFPANSGRDSNTDSGFMYVRMVKRIAPDLEQQPPHLLAHGSVGIQVIWKLNNRGPAWGLVPQVHR